MRQRRTFVAPERVFLLALLISLVTAGISYAQFDRETLRWINTEPRVREIKIKGNDFFSDSHIRNQLFSRTYRGFIRGSLGHPRGSRLRRETIIRDTAQVKGLYLKEGFLTVLIEESFERLEDSSARVVFEINEGPRFLLSEVTVSGDYQGSFVRNIWEITKRLKPGKPVNLFELRQTQLGLKELFANNGYPYAQIEYIVDTAASPGATPVTYTIETDSLVHFGSVAVSGTKLYGESTAFRELKISPGAIYRRRDIQSSQLRLLRSGFYTGAHLQALDSAEVGESYDRYAPGFRATVKEKRAHFVTVRTGVAQDSVRDLVWDQRLGWGKRNVFGSRRVELTANGVFSPLHGRFVLSHRYRARYVEPWFIGIRMPLSLSAELEPGVKSLVQPFRVRRWSLDAQTLWEPGRRNRVVVGFEYESVKIFDIDSLEIESFKEQEGISVRRKLYGSLRRDTRDDLFVPRHGSLLEMKFDFFGGPLGGDESFWKVDLSWSRYQIFFGPVLRATRIQFGLAAPLRSTDRVPAIDRFYLGGANSIRGFSTNELGPGGGDDEFSAGAEFFMIFNQELRFPIYKKFWGSLFFDAGNGWTGLDDPNLSFAGAAYSYGMGLQYHSPAGPLRLDYARRIRSSGIADIAPPDHRFHFTILYAF